MSTLKRTLENDRMTAMKSGDTLVLNTLRLVLGDMQTAEKRIKIKDGEGIQEFTEDQVSQFVASQAKSRQDSAEMYREAGQSERAQLFLDEAAVLKRYLPEEMTEGEVVELINKAVAEIDNPTPKSMGVVMGKLKPVIGTRFNGKRLSELVREAVSSAS